MLRQVLGSLAAQSAPDDSFEVLVVDNACTDGTGEMVAGWQAGPANLRLVKEPSPGLSVARNAGWHAAKGRVVAFVDDDMHLDADWVENLLRGFASAPEDVACLAGKVRLGLRGARPAWLSDDLAMCLSCIDWGPMAIPLAPDRHFAGCNFAVLRAVIERLGGFPEFLGRVGNKLLSNEEVMFARGIRELGFEIWYDPAVAGTHHVPEDRLRQPWFIRRSFWQGVSEAVMHTRAFGLGWTERLRRTAKVALHLVSPPRKILWLAAPTQGRDRFDLKCAAWGTLGYMAGMLGWAK